MILNLKLLLLLIIFAHKAHLNTISSTVGWEILLYWEVLIVSWGMTSRVVATIFAILWIDPLICILWRLSWLHLTIILLLVNLLILHLLANEFIHIIRTSTHCTICSVILRHEVSALLTCPGLKATVARHSCSRWWRLLLDVQLILQSGILTYRWFLASSVILCLVVVPVVVWIILHVAVVLLVRWVTNASIVLILTLVATRYSSLIIRVLVIWLSSLVLVLWILILGTVCAILLTCNTSRRPAHRIVQILDLLFIIIVNLLLTSWILLLHKLTSIVLRK